MIKFNMLNYIDIRIGQELFETFRKMTGITIAYAIQRILQDEDDYSNSFCKNCVKSSEKGQKRCVNNFKEYVKKISKTKDFEVIVCPCHAGLVDIIAPIRVNGEIGTFVVAGQCLFTKHNLKKARAYAKELGIDEEKYVEEYKKVKYITPENQPLLLDFIKKLVIFISGIATRNYKSFQKANEDLLTLSMLEGINNSFHISDTLRIACQELCALYNISSAKVFQFNKSEETFMTLLSYKLDKNAPDLTIKYDNETYLSKIMDFWCANIDEEASGRQVGFYDMTKKSRVPKTVRDLYTSAGIYSITAMKLRTTDNSYVILSLLDSDTSRKWSETDLKFLELIGKNIAIAVKQNYLTESLSNESKSLRAILNSFQFPIYFKDLKGRFVNVNKAFCTYQNIVDADLVIGKTADECFGTERYKIINDAEKFVLSTKQAISLDRVQDKNSTFDVKVFPICDDDNMFGVFVHILNVEKISPAKAVQAKTTTQKLLPQKTKESYTAKKSGRIYKKKV